TDEGRSVSVCGWVASRREHGEHLAFVDLRDHTGLVQCVVDNAHDLRSEYVLRITGTVRKRPEGTINPNLGTGEIELGDCVVEVLNTAEPPPFPVTDRVDADETTRMRYRFVDLRRERMQRNLRIRAAMSSAIRTSLEKQGFAEVETPLLWTPTPEGAREFLVPSRQTPGSFYVLPQSPQIAKQLLMVGGFDRYFQIARCARDEDLRADRQYEFMQLDLEASFVEQEDVLGFVSQAVLDATEAVTGTRPSDEIPRMTWHEAMDRYGSDKPDIRFGMELVELSEVFAATEFKAFAGKRVKGILVTGGADFTRNRLDGLTDKAKSWGAGGLVWMRVSSPTELDSPVAKFLTPEETKALIDTMQASAGDLLLLVADGDVRTVRHVLGLLRLELGQPPLDEGGFHFLWVVEFPMFEALGDDG